MKLSDIALNRPVTTIIMVFLVVLLGFIAFNRIGIDLFPDISLPAVVVITNYEGVGPEEIETMVTRPIEGAIATITNINNISSISSTGSSIVIAEFNWGTDMDKATMDMREAVDLIEAYLPDEVSKPMIVKFDPSMLPIMQLGVAGKIDLASLKTLLEKEFVPVLERLDGVAQVSLVGGLEREILITLNQTKMNNYHISFSNVTTALMMENMNLSGGHISRGDKDLLVRVTGKFDSVEEIKNILIPTATGYVLLEDIAEIEDTYKDISNLSRLNGETCIGVTIQKQTDANTVDVSDRVNKEIEKILGEIDVDIRVIPVMDQASFIKTAINSVGMNGIIGGLLAVLILYLFLRNYRSTLIIAISIPVSIIATFMLIYFADLTLNLMTLGGLALGIGMLVDNSIVVLENIYRYRTLGYNRYEAALHGAQEIGTAITASTLTTIVVFLPIVFMGGIAAEIFKELALTVSFSLMVSLVVALTLIPVMSAKMLKISSDEGKKGKALFEKIKELYRKSLAWSLDHRALVSIVFIAVLIFSLLFIPFIGAEFIPEMDQGQFTINIELPLGTSLEETNRITAAIEDIVLKLPETAGVLANVGSSSDLMAVMETSSSDLSSLIVLLKPRSERERSTSEVMEDLREKIRVPGADISISAVNIAEIAGSPVSIKINGNDLALLEELALKVKDVMAGIEGIREIEDSISKGRPELQIKINRSLAAQFGLRPAQIGAVVKSAISGDIASRYEVAGEEIDIRVRLDKEDISSIEQLKNLLLPSPTGALVPLERVAEFRLATGARQILRENQVRYVEITAELYNTNLAKVMPLIREKIEESIDLPVGYQLEYGGEYSEMMEAFSDLYYTALLAIVLVYMVMVSQFESLVHPFIIMFTVPMAAIGVIFALLFSGHTLSVISFIGIIMLAGIVVNNAIVMIDYINTLRNKGKNVRETLLEAGPVRLRPILMTTLTTILALLPQAIGRGEGSELSSPLAVVVMGGLIVSTFLTLYLIPIIYSFIAGIKKKAVHE
jgi:HAE1 family hydrophobic/amphiphilic exporter-1